MSRNVDENLGNIFKIATTSTAMGDNFFKVNLEEIRELAEETQQSNRTKLKSMGYQLQENKIPKNKVSRNNDNTINLNNEGGDGSNLGIEPHPLMPPSNGKVNIVLPGMIDLDQTDLNALPPDARAAAEEAIKRKKAKIDQQLRMQNKLRNKPNLAPRPESPRLTIAPPRSKPLPRPRPI